jgi:hypothetical protein
MACEQCDSVILPFQTFENDEYGRLHTSVATTGGYVFALPKDAATSSPYVFRCSCSVGRSKRQVGIPVWGPEWERRFLPEYKFKKKELEAFTTEKKEKLAEQIHVTVHPDDKFTEEYAIKLMQEGLTDTPDFKECIKKFGREPLVDLWKKIKSAKSTA